MKISIVTPNLNCGKYLFETLESVINQGYESVEHIVLDGGSADGSIEILKEWTRTMGGSIDHANDKQDAEIGGQAASADGRYTFRWISEKDKGQTDAINKGFRMASGDIRTWLNADEFYYPGALQAVADFFAKKPETGLLYGQALFTREDGSPIRVRPTHAPDRNVFIYYGCYIISVAAFYNGRIFDDGVFLDDSYRVTMDFEFYARLWQLGYPVEYIPRALGAFRMTGDNVSVKLEERRKAERLQVQQQYGSRFPWGTPLPKPVLAMLRQVFRLKSGWMRLSGMKPPAEEC